MRRTGANGQSRRPPAEESALQSLGLRADWRSRATRGVWFSLLFLVPLAFLSQQVWISQGSGSGQAVVAEFQWSKAFVLNFLATLLLLAAAGRLRSPARPPLTLIATVLFSAVLCSSLLYSKRRESLEALALVGGPVLLSISLRFLPRENTPVEIFFSATLLSAVVVSVFGALQRLHLVYLPLTQYGQPSAGSFLGLANFASEFLLIPLSLSLGLLAMGRKRLLAALACLMIGFDLLIADVRASWFAVAGEIVLAGALWAISARKNPILRLGRKEKKRVFGLLAVLFVVLGGVALSSSSRHFWERASSFLDSEEPSRKVRLLTWQMGLAIFRDHPLIGIGLGNTQVFAPRYASEELERLYLVSSTKVDHVHNEYLQVLVESGILGFCALALLLVALLRLGLRNLAVADDREQFFRRLALFTGLAGVLFNAFFSFPLRNPATGLTFWLATALLERETIGAFRSPIARPTALRGPANVLLTIIFVGSFFALAIFNARLARAELQTRVATTHLRAGRWDEARAAATKAISVNSADPNAYHVRGLAALNSGDLDSAIRDLEQCLSLAPELERAHLALAFACYDKGNFSRARDEFLIAAPAMRSRKKEILGALVSVYLNLKQSDKAMEAAKEAVRSDPRSPELRYKLAYAYAASGLVAEAVAACRVALNLKPDFPEAQALLDRLTRAP